MSPPLNKLAIAAGTIAGFAGGLLTMFAAMFAGAIVQGVQGRAPDENTINSWFQDPAALLTLQAINIAWLVAGGFLAATLAGREHLRHGAWTGIVALVLSLLTLALPSPEGASMPWWSMVLALVTTVPAAIVGGYLAGRRNGRP